VISNKGHTTKPSPLDGLAKRCGTKSSLPLTIVLLHLLFYRVPIPKILVVENVFDG
jgi:hypothetical protein